jgi:hypothetical protein
MPFRHVHLCLDYKFLVLLLAFAFFPEAGEASVLFVPYCGTSHQNTPCKRCHEIRLTRCYSGKLVLLKDYSAKYKFCYDECLFEITSSR